jgi:hypothetical protein
MNSAGITGAVQRMGTEKTVDACALAADHSPGEGAATNPETGGWNE